MSARRCMIARGSREGTRADALRALEKLAPHDVAWVSGDSATPFVHTPTARALLGRSFDAVVLDLHDGIDADLLGQCHGLVWGGGCLVLRMPDAPPPQPTLAVHPYTTADVGTRFWDRFERCLARSDALVPLAPIAPASHDVRGNDEQRAVVRAIASTFVSERPALLAVLADRGRGKSSALGLALTEAASQRSLHIAVTAASESAVLEVLRFAPDGVSFALPLDLVRGDEDPDVIVVDEAAQLPVPLLQALVRRHPRARIAFATTVHGYEGTGRGFALRFLAWAERRSLTVHTLEAPIRYDANDPLERLVFDALALDADPARDASEIDASRLEHVVFDRDALAEDERTLRELFGLLVHAHYRTTPSDLHRLLDAPNLAVHALLGEGHVVAASLVAREGELPIELSRELARGEGRIRGHALADTIVCHSDRPDAGPLSMIRSVRIAVHPELRRRGVARALVEHVHRTYAPDLFGTIFGATPELLRFRRAVGYELVRVGVSRGARTGEPAAVMVRPMSGRAAALVTDLRAELARNLPLQLELMDADGELIVEPHLAEALLAGLPTPTPLTEEELRSIVRSFLVGPRPYESAAYALTRFVEAHVDRMGELSLTHRTLIEGRVRDRHPWARVARDAGCPSVPAAMRALRRAVRELAELVDPALTSRPE